MRRAIEDLELAYLLHKEEGFSWRSVARVINTMRGTNFQGASVQAAVTRWLRGRT